MLCPGTLTRYGKAYFYATERKFPWSRDHSKTVYEITLNTQRRVLSTLRDAYLGQGMLTGGEGSQYN